MSEHLHDPGGKVRLKLATNIRGTALFSNCGKFRQVLTREWDDAPKLGTVLFIGMNPSTAAGDVDDPTVFKETKYTRRWGYGRYVKCNVMDHRATKPKMLLLPNVVPCSPENMPIIIREARFADIVVLAYGALHKKLAHYGENVVRELKDNGIKIHVLGLTKAGHPRHPLYLKDDAELMEFAA